MTQFHPDALYVVRNLPESSGKTHTETPFESASALYDRVLVRRASGNTGKKFIPR